MKIVRGYGELNPVLLKITDIVLFMTFLGAVVIALDILGLNLIGFEFNAAAPILLQLIFVTIFNRSIKSKLIDPNHKKSDSHYIVKLIPVACLIIFIFVDYMIIRDILKGEGEASLWFSLLIIPNILALYIQFQLAIKYKKHEYDDLEDDEEDEDLTYFEYVAKTAKIYNDGSITNEINTAMSMLIIFPTAIFFFFIGYMYFIFLAETLFNHRNISEVIEFVDFYQVVIEQLPTIGIATLGLVIYQCYQIFRIKHREKKQRKEQPEYYRDLNEQEIDLIKYALTKLEDYIKNKRFSRNIKVLYFLDAPITYLLFISSLLLAMFSTYFFSFMFETWRSLGLEWYFYDDSFILTGILLFFTIILSIITLKGRLFPRLKNYQEYKTIREYGCNHDKEDVIGGLEFAIEEDIRNNKVASIPDFNPSSYLRSKQKPIKRWWTKVLIICAIFNALLFWLESNKYTLFMPDYIEYGKYISIEEDYYNYNAVTYIQTECFQDGPSLRIKYKVNVIDDLITLIDDRSELHDNLDALESFEQLIKSKRVVKFTRYLVNSPRDLNPRYDNMLCIQGLSERYSPDDAERMMKLLSE